MDTIAGTVPWAHENSLQAAQPHPESKPVLVPLPRSVETSEVRPFVGLPPTAYFLTYGYLVILARADPEALHLTEPSAVRPTDQLSHADPQHSEKRSCGGWRASRCASCSRDKT